MKQLTTHDLNRANIPERFWTAAFGEIPETAPYRPVVGKYLKELPRFVEEGVGLFLWNPLNGTGKTSIACTIGMRALRLGYSVYFIRTETLKEANVEGLMFDEARTIMDRVREVDIAILDDFGKEYKKSGSGYTETMIEDLFREKSQRKKVLIPTSNLEPGQIKELFSVDLAEVMKESMLTLRIVGEDEGGVNWRERKKNEIRKLLEA
jgi:hypothetical protein